jgi:hypothetical protein
MRHCTTGQTCCVHDTGQAGRTAADPCVLTLAEWTSDLQRGFFCLTKLVDRILCILVLCLERIYNCKLPATKINSHLIKFLMKNIYIYGFKLFYYKNTFHNKSNIFILYHNF